MKLLSLIPKLTKHVIHIRNEDHSNTILLENIHARSEKLTDLLHLKMITCAM